MLDPAYIWPLAGEALLLVLFGLIGCAAAERLRGPRLVGGVLAGFLFTTALAGEGGPLRQPRQALDDYLQARAEARKIAQTTDATPVYLEEFDAQTRQEAQQLQLRLDEVRARRELYSALGIGFPTVLVAIGITLICAPQRAGFARHLPFMLSAAIVAAALAVLAGWIFLKFGWVQHEPVNRWSWLLGLAACCAIGSAPLRQSADPAMRYPIWRSVFEPLLYALVGSRIQPVQGWDWVLIIGVLILFADGKALGAMALRRYVSRRSWPDALRIGTRIAAGSPAALAVAYGFYAVAAIDANLFTALAVAAVVSALLVRLMLRMIPDDDLRPAASGPAPPPVP